MDKRIKEQLRNQTEKLDEIKKIEHTNVIVYSSTQEGKIRN